MSGFLIFLLFVLPFPKIKGNDEVKNITKVKNVGYFLAVLSTKIQSEESPHALNLGGVAY